MDTTKREVFNFDDSPSKDELFLHSTWKFWADKYNPDRSAEEYQNSQEVLSSFNTVQTFWERFNALPKIDNDINGYDTHMMRDGISPLWEDSENGGFWVVRMKKEYAQDAWKEICLSCIGEHFSDVLDDDDDVNGVTASIRKDNVVFRIWNKNNGSGKERIIEYIQAHVFGKFEKDLISFYKACEDHTKYDTTLRKKIEEKKK